MSDHAPLWRIGAAQPVASEPAAAFAGARWRSHVRAVELHSLAVLDSPKLFSLYPNFEPHGKSILEIGCGTGGRAARWPPPAPRGWWASTSMSKRSTSPKSCVATCFRKAADSWSITPARRTICWISASSIWCSWSMRWSTLSRHPASCNWRVSTPRPRREILFLNDRMVSP